MQPRKFLAKITWPTTLLAQARDGQIMVHWMIWSGALCPCDHKKAR